MKLENQVTSLEVSQKLKALGVKHESFFWWDGFGRFDGGFSIHYPRPVMGGAKSLTFSAFTVAELGEMLPEYIVTMKRNPDEYACFNHITHTSKDYGVHVATTEADARGKMLIYLLENNLTGE